MRADERESSLAFTEPRTREIIGLWWQARNKESAETIVLVFVRSLSRQREIHFNATPCHKDTVYVFDSIGLILRLLLISVNVTPQDLGWLRRSREPP